MVVCRRTRRFVGERFGAFIRGPYRKKIKGCCVLREGLFDMLFAGMRVQSICLWSRCGWPRCGRSSRWEEKKFIHPHRWYGGDEVIASHMISSNALGVTSDCGDLEEAAGTCLFV